MKYIFSICFFLLLASTVFSQEKHFIFIQSDNKQLFNVTINGKLYSSNASGYVIIPRLLDGDYSLTVGFPKNTFPDQQFQCTVNKKDIGYALKDFGEKGWGLFNLQTLDVTMSSSKTEFPTIAKETIKPKDEPITFNTLKEEIKPATQTAEKPRTETIIQPKPVEEKVAQQNEVVSTDTIPSPVVQETAKSTPTNSISKISEAKNNNGVSITYADINNGVADTIQIDIPVNETAAINEVNADTLNAVREDSAIKAKIEMFNQRTQDVKVIDLDRNEIKSEKVKDSVAENKDVKDTAIYVAPSVAEKTESVVAKSTNSFCTEVASETEYLKLRRKMALEFSDEKMIKEAKKVFKDRCFTTQQIKGLSTLFLTDEGRFRFLSASYSFVSDLGNFKSLQSLLIDPIYIDRMKAIIQ